MKLFRIGLVILGLHTGVSLAAKWTPASSGLTGSVAGINHLVIDASGSTLYAAGNGLFRSTDGGLSWTLLSVIGVQVVALDPTSALMIYAGTTSGVLRSTDGGESWSPAGLAGHSVTILAADPATPSTLYAAAGTGDANIYKSTDAGQSWTAVSVGPALGSLTGISSLTLEPGTPSTLYVVANGSPGSYGLYKSTDAGQTWNLVKSGLVRLLAIAPTTPSTLYAIVPPGLATSTDGGATWNQTGFTLDVFALAIDPANPDALYAAARNPNVSKPPAIFKSTDGGQNWDSGNTTVPLAQSLVVSPVDLSTIYAATAGGVFKSTDRGANWGAANTGLNVFDIEVLVGDPVNPATIYAGGNNGLFQSVDSGESWSQLATFQRTCCGYVSGFPPGVYPPNYGQVYPAAVTSLLIDFANPNILYAGTYDGDGISPASIPYCELLGSYLHKSTNGGKTWSDSSGPRGGEGTDCWDGPLMAMDPTDPNILYLRIGDDYDGYTLQKSTDGGASWSGIGLEAGNGLNAVGIDPITPTTLYAATNSTSPADSECALTNCSVIGSVQQSTNGGATWKFVGLANQDVSLLAIDPLQPNVLYAVVTSNPRGLFKSTDSGANWSPINNGLGDLLGASVNVNVLVLDPDHPDVLYLGTSGCGVFKSSDGGATWAAFNDGLAFLDVRSLAIVGGAFPAVYAGTPGGIFKIVNPRS